MICLILVQPFGTKTLTQSNIVTILIPSNILENISKRNLKILIIFFELVFNFLV